MAEVPFGWLIPLDPLLGREHLRRRGDPSFPLRVLPRRPTARPASSPGSRALSFSSWRSRSGSPGYLLPWNTLVVLRHQSRERTFRRRSHGSGRSSREFFAGGSDVTGATLSRFYGIHVAILPATATILLGVHLYLVQLHGMSVPPRSNAKAPRRTMKFFPDFLLRDMVGWLIAVASLAVLCVFFPWELGRESRIPSLRRRPVFVPNGDLLSMFQALKYFPATIAGIPGELFGIVGFGVIGLVVLLVPFLDRKAVEGRSLPGGTGSACSCSSRRSSSRCWRCCRRPEQERR